jgi:hypothetical protein
MPSVAFQALAIPTPADLRQVRLQDDELAEYAFYPLGSSLASVVIPLLGRRVTAAASARIEGQTL